VKPFRISDCEFRICPTVILIITLGIGFLAAPPSVDAQPTGKVYRIGILEAIPAARNAPNLDALRRGLRELGYVEGRNLVIEYRSADGRAERFPDLASELVRLKVDLIVTRGTPAARAAKNATGIIPVVMATMGEPHPIVASLARPGGNITGVTTFSTELTGKRIELLKELVPSVSRVALLHNMGNPAVPPEWEETKTAARSLGLQAELLDVRSRDDLDRAFELAVRQHVDALLIGAEPENVEQASSLLVRVASGHPGDGARKPRQPADKMSAPRRRI